MDMLNLKQRLSAIMQQDPHTIDGKYEIRSLYFDDAQNSALKEKINGVNIREKFRIRYYNGDTSLIKLEKKSKINGLCQKESVRLTAEQTNRILSGDTAWMMESDQPLLREFCLKIRQKGIRPKTIVDYTREPFIFAPGNVRVTLDYHIRTGLSGTDFLNPDCVTIPVAENPIILEIKWDGYLPEIIRCAVQLEHGRIGAYSKYASCRMYD